MNNKVKKGKHRHKWELYSTGWCGNLLSGSNYEYACTVKGCKARKFTEEKMRPLNNKVEG